MLAHTKTRHTSRGRIRIIIETLSGKRSYDNIDDCKIAEIEKILNTTSEEDAPVSWESLAKERIEKHGKSGLVLRGIRYREGISQKELARRSGIAQNEISKIENGKRRVGEKVARKLAESLSIDYLLLIDG